MFATFQLERFGWQARDRLELAGRFLGLHELPSEAPVLVVRGADRTHRLAAVPGSVSGTPADGSTWRAAFAWQEAPAPFDLAQLALADDIVVDLPAPRGRRFRHHTLDVRHVARPATAPDDGTAGGADRLRLQAELLAAQEQVHAARAQLQHQQEELARTRADLAAARERHGSDAERFREGLERLRASAEEAIAAEQAAAAQLGADLREAHGAIEAREGRLEEARGALEAAEDARERVESEAAVELDGLRARVAMLERAAQESERLTAELAQARTEADAAREQLAAAEGAAQQAQAEADRLLGRLTSIRDALAEGS